MTDRQILHAVGKRVREARLKAGLTQECLAELVGIHWKTLGRIERGEFPFATTTFVRLAQYLQVNPNQLVGSISLPDRTRLEQIMKAKARKRRPSTQ